MKLSVGNVEDMIQLSRPALTGTWRWTSIHDAVQWWTGWMGPAGAVFVPRLLVPLGLLGDVPWPSLPSVQSSPQRGNLWGQIELSLAACQVVTVVILPSNMPLVPKNHPQACLSL